METLGEQYSTLRSWGFTGALEDMMKAYYNAISGTSHSLPDALYTYLRSVGFRGAVEDMLFTNDSTFINKLYLINGGRVPSSATYSRSGAGYSIGSTEIPDTTAANTAMYDTSGTEIRYLSYSGTNKCTVDGVFTTNTTNIDKKNCDISIVNGFCRLENNTGLDDFPTIGGTVGNLNLHSWCIYAKGSTGSAANLNGGTEQPISTTLSIVGQVSVTPNQTYRTIYIKVPKGGWVEFQLPQLTETCYHLPHIISSSSGAVTVNQPDLKIGAGVAGAYDPYVSAAQTQYGIDELLNGVDGLDAVCKIVFENFSVYDIAADIDLILNNSGTRILWVEASTGLIKATDGTLTCESDAGISVNTEYDFYLKCDGTQFWINLDGTDGTKVNFDGSFATVGDYIKYTDSPVAHTVSDIYFSVS